LCAIPKNLLEALVEFLTPFQAATLALEMSLKLTIHTAIYWCDHLCKHLGPVSEDVVAADVTITKGKDLQEIAAMKLLLRLILIEKFTLSENHIQAAILDPLMKNCLTAKYMVSEDDLAKAKVHIQDLIVTPSPPDIVKTIEKPILVSPPNPRKRTLVQSMYDDDGGGGEDLSQNDAATSTSVVGRAASEFDAYWAHSVSKADWAEFDILQWWKLKGGVSFPMLAMVARCILCIPASSAKSETNTLKPRTVNDLMFFRSNADLCNQRSPAFMANTCHEDGIL
jgi:hypothetical protein